MSPHPMVVEGVRFAYPGAGDVLADVGFTLHAGTVTALVGRNGAGKSTLLRLLNGLLRPAGGRILIGGADATAMPVHRIAHRVGTVFQAPEQQIFNATVREEVAFGPRQQGLDDSSCRDRVREALERTGMAGAIDLHPLDLDQASRRFVAVASVLATRPDVLLLDEAQRGLDRPHRDRLERLIREETAAGRAVVLVCHDVEFAARAASTVLALAEGRVLADLPVRDFFASEALTRGASVEQPRALRLALRLGLPPCLTPEELAAALSRPDVGRKERLA